MKKYDVPKLDTEYIDISDSILASSNSVNIEDSNDLFTDINEIL